MYTKMYTELNTIYVIGCHYAYFYDVFIGMIANNTHFVMILQIQIPSSTLIKLRLLRSFFMLYADFATNFIDPDSPWVTTTFTLLYSAFFW